MNPQFNAFVSVNAELALRSARELDDKLAKGDSVGSLAGVPFGVKDNEDCSGYPTSRGSIFFKNSALASRDSTVVARLRAAGAIPVGKTAAAEFGLDGVTHTLAWGTTRNPWSRERTPGGSSGGSAAAVAAGLVPLCTASDGGGSTRVPAAFTGLVGMKPTHGRISRNNGASDINSPGALTMTVADTARFLDVVSGPDERDRMSLPRATLSYEEALNEVDITGLTAVWSSDLGFAVVDPLVATTARSAAIRLAQAADLRLIDRPLNLTNIYADWARLAAHRLRMQLEYEGFLPARLHEMSPGPRSLLEEFGHSSERELLRASQRTLQLASEVAELFSTVDFLLTPTAACVAYAAAGPLPDAIAGRDARGSGGEPFTMLANTCWMPSISVPAGLGTDELPVGLMITGRRHRDELVLRLARLAELALPWPRTAPGFG